MSVIGLQDFKKDRNLDEYEIEGYKPFYKIEPDELARDVFHDRENQYGYSIMCVRAYDDSLKVDVLVQDLYDEREITIYYR